LLCPLNDTIIRNGTFNGRPGILNSPDSLLNRYVIILVSTALKTVTVASANDFFKVLSVTRPEMLPFCAFTSITKKINREVNKSFFINVSYGKAIAYPAGKSCCFLKEYLIREKLFKVYCAIGTGDIKLRWPGCITGFKRVPETFDSVKTAGAVFYGNGCNRFRLCLIRNSIG
jgi:hypothetical protein